MAEQASVAFIAPVDRGVETWTRNRPAECEALRRFLAEMANELAANQHKGDRPGWLQMSPEQAVAELLYHVGKLSLAVREVGSGKAPDPRTSGFAPDDVREFAADTANCALMVLDVLGLLIPPELDDRSTQQDQPEVAIEQGGDAHVRGSDHSRGEDETGLQVAGAGVAIEGDPGPESSGVEEGAVELIRSMVSLNERLCVCAGAGQVVRDCQRPVPYPVDGCLVGLPTQLDDDGFVLAGMTFETRIEWKDVRGAWLRNAAPDPCPHCGASTGPSTQQSTTGKEDCERCGGSRFVDSGNPDLPIKPCPDCKPEVRS